MATSSSSQQPVSTGNPSRAGARGGGVDRDQFVSGMRCAASGVVVVTCWVDSRPWGLTISSFISVSAEPPRVLVSLQSTTASSRSIEESGSFGVSMLGSEHHSVAKLCSERGTPKFIDDHVVDVNACDASPRLRSALVHMDCAVEDVVEVGDHKLFVASVVDVIHTEDGPPLIYTNGVFHHIGAPVDRSSGGGSDE